MVVSPYEPLPGAQDQGAMIPTSYGAVVAIANMAHNHLLLAYRVGGILAFFRAGWRLAAWARENRKTIQTVYEAALNQAVCMEALYKARKEGDV